MLILVNTKVIVLEITSAASIKDRFSQAISKKPTYQNLFLTAFVLHFCTCEEIDKMVFNRVFL
jgi:hypothetical protein